MEDVGVPASETVWTILGLDLLVGFIAFIMFGAMLIRAARYPGLAPLVAPLAMLSGLALIIGGASDNTALVALASTGIGALAAGLTQTIRGKDTPKPGDDETPPEA